MSTPPDVMAAGRTGTIPRFRPELPPRLHQFVAILGATLLAWLADWLLGPAKPGVALTVAVPLVGLVLLSLAVALRRAWPLAWAAQRASLRDGLFKGFGWIAGAALGARAAYGGESLLGVWLFDSALEGAARPLAAGLGIALGLATALAWRRLPARLAAGRMAGDGRAAAAADMLPLGALGMPSLPLAFYAGAYAGVDSAVFDGPVLLLAWIAAYGALRRLGPAPESAGPGLWVVLPADGAGHPRSAANALAALWKTGPVTVLAPAASPVATDHLQLADAADMARALFPESAAGVDHWRRLTPDAAQWRCLPQRQIQPVGEALFARALDTLPGVRDRVLLICTDATHLERWRRHLPVGRAAAAWAGAPGGAPEGMPDLAAGGLRAACRELLKTLQPAEEAPVPAAREAGSVEAEAAPPAGPPPSGLLDPRTGHPVALPALDGRNADAAVHVAVGVARGELGNAVGKLLEALSFIEHCRPYRVDPAVLDDPGRLANALGSLDALILPVNDAPQAGSPGHLERQETAWVRAPFLAAGRESMLLHLDLESRVPGGGGADAYVRERRAKAADQGAVLDAIRRLCDPLRVCICAESDAETFLVPIERQLAGTLAEAARLSGPARPPALRVSIVTLAGLHAAGAALSRADIAMLAVEADRARLESLCEHLNRNLDPPPFHRVAAWVNGPRDGPLPPTLQGWNVVGFRVAGGNATAQHEPDAGRLRDLMQAVLRQRSGGPRPAAEPAGTPGSPAVFLSYCSEYRPYANAIASALWRLGVTVHWDGGLAPGDAWEERLAQMLRESDAVLALVGRLTAGRANPMREIRTALSLGKTLLPVWVEPIDGPPEVLRFQFANRSGNGGTVFLAGLTGRRLEDEAVAIADRIGAALGGRQAPPDLSSAPTAGSNARATADEILARIAGKLSGETGPDRQSTGHFLEIREGLQADLAALVGLDVGDSDGSTWPHRFTLETTSGLWIGLARQVQEGDGRAPRYRDCLLLHRVAAVVDGARLVESWSPDPALRDPVLAFGVIVAGAGEVPLGELPGSGTQAA